MNSEDIIIENMLKSYTVAKLPVELKARIFQSKRKLHIRVWFVIAASIFIVVGVSLMWQVSLKTQNAKLNHLELVNMEKSIMQSGQAAQLLAIADFFANQPAGKDHAKEIYHEITFIYPASEARMKAQMRLKSF